MQSLKQRIGWSAPTHSRGIASVDKKTSSHSGRKPWFSRIAIAALVIVLLYGFGVAQWMKRVLHENWQLQTHVSDVESKLQESQRVLEELRNQSERTNGKSDALGALDELDESAVKEAVLEIAARLKERDSLQVGADAEEADAEQRQKDEEAEKAEKAKTIKKERRELAKLAKLAVVKWDPERPLRDLKKVKQSTECLLRGQMRGSYGDHVLEMNRYDLLKVRRGDLSCMNDSTAVLMRKTLGLGSAASHVVAGMSGRLLVADTPGLRQLQVVDAYQRVLAASLPYPIDATVVGHAGTKHALFVLVEYNSTKPERVLAVRKSSDEDAVETFSRSYGIVEWRLSDFSCALVHELPAVVGVQLTGIAAGSAQEGSNLLVTVDSTAMIAVDTSTGEVYGSSYTVRDVPFHSGALGDLALSANGLTVAFMPRGESREGESEPGDQESNLRTHGILLLPEYVHQVNKPSLEFRFAPFPEEWAASWVLSGYSNGAAAAWVFGAHGAWISQPAKTIISDAACIGAISQHKLDSDYACVEEGSQIKLYHSFRDSAREWTVEPRGNLRVHSSDATAVAWTVNVVEEVDPDGPQLPAPHRRLWYLPDASILLMLNHEMTSFNIYPLSSSTTASETVYRSSAEKIAMEHAKIKDCPLEWTDSD